jgi:hypothetical protein
MQFMLVRLTLRWNEDFLFVGCRAALSANGIERVALNVFGSNTIAQKLYKSMGFRATQIQMARDLGS